MGNLERKKKKVEKKNFYMRKMTAKWSLVILSALVIYTAPTVRQQLIDTVFITLLPSLKLHPNFIIQVTPYFFISFSST
jgi:hypothetical protein